MHECAPSQQPKVVLVLDLEEVRYRKVSYLGG